MDAPIFIIGQARSGTTLLADILSAHPSIEIALESHFFDYHLKRHPHLATDERAFERFWTEFHKAEYWVQAGVDPDDARPRVRAAMGTAAGVFAAIAREPARVHGAERWGEKTPGHERHLSALRRGFPHARVLYIVRDPRAVVASLARVPWTAVSPLLAARRWAASVAENLPRAARGDVHLVRYETLVADPEAVMHLVCDFIHEPFDAVMLDHVATAARRHPDAGAWTAPNLQPITSGYTSRWREQLSVAHLAAIEWITRRGRAVLDYPAAGPAPSWGERTRLDVATSLWRVRRVVPRPSRPPYNPWYFDKR